ncbi:hypothetical protein AMTRI_Chr11g154710 [Amborella trichopoda]
MMDLSVVPYSHNSPGNSSTGGGPKPEKNGGVLDPLDSPLSKPSYLIRYRECLKNHAAAIGGHANDGCGEFMAAGEEGSIEALKCAACGCHRNFHRKEISVTPLPFSSPYLHNAAPTWDKKLKFPPPLTRSIDNEGFTVFGQGGGTKNGTKRYRTKFTQDQKEKMQAFADKLGWRIQKQDDVALQQFCMEVGVKRHVLKVWMHNNKNTLGKKDSLTAST